MINIIAIDTWHCLQCSGSQIKIIKLITVFFFFQWRQNHLSFDESDWKTIRKLCKTQTQLNAVLRLIRLKCKYRKYKHPFTTLIENKIKWTKRLFAARINKNKMMLWIARSPCIDHFLFYSAVRAQNSRMLTVPVVKWILTPAIAGPFCETWNTCVTFNRFFWIDFLSFLLYFAFNVAVPCFVGFSHSSWITVSELMSRTIQFRTHKHQKYNDKNVTAPNAQEFFLFLCAHFVCPSYIVHTENRQETRQLANAIPNIVQRI